MPSYRETFYHYSHMFNISTYRYRNENWIDISFYVVVKVNFFSVYWSITKWRNYVNIRVVIKVFFMLTEMWNFMHYETLSLNKMSAIFRKIAAYIFLKVCLSFLYSFSVRRNVQLVTFSYQISQFLFGLDDSHLRSPMSGSKLGPPALFNAFSKTWYFVPYLR